MVNIRGSVLIVSDSSESNKSNTGSLTRSEEAAVTRASEPCARPVNTAPRANPMQTDNALPRQTRADALGTQAYFIIFKQAQAGAEE